MNVKDIREENLEAELLNYLKLFKTFLKNVPKMLNVSLNSEC